MEERHWRPSRPLDLRRTLAPLCRGAGDPAMRLGHAHAWRATRTPDGPATVHLAVDGGAVSAQAWGQGAAWAAEHAPALVGEGDDDASFTARHPIVTDLRRRHPGVRVPRSDAVVESLVPAVLEQKVLGVEARFAYRLLVRTLGEPAPGPGGQLGLVVPPDSATLAGTPSYVFHPWGVERRRADTVRRVAALALRLEEVRTMDRSAAYRRLTAVPGVGPWSAAETAFRALGDADAVSVGDYHVKHLVSWALAGEPRGTDERMLELLEPYAGHRGRVVRLLELGAGRPPRRGPRLPRQRIAAL